MKRKVNRVGQNTLTVSLPSKWVKEHNIKAGDELDLDNQDDGLVINRSLMAKEEKKATINVDENTYLSLVRIIYLLYRTNYDKINLVYSKQTIFDPKRERKNNIKILTKNIVSRLLGAEITSQSSNRTEIECFASENDPNLDKIEKRVYFLIRETVDELLNAIGPKYSDFHKTMYDHHDHISRFINYFLRELHKSSKTEEEKKVAYSFYMDLDHLVDKLRHLSEKINRFGCTKKTKKYIEETFDFFYGQFNALFKKKISHEMIQKRYDIKEKINNDSFTAKELRVISELYFFLDTLNVFSGYILLKGMGKK